MGCIPRRVASFAIAALLAAAARADSLAHCTTATEPSAAQQDRLLLVAERVRQVLAQSGAAVALVARSGQALQRLGLRYSHAGLALRHNPQAPWAVRQLYFDCEQRRPRVFDQGLSGFALGMHDPDQGFLLILIPPEPAQEPLARAALDDTRAISLLGEAYSANAHAWGTRLQNCNQWAAELLAHAWGQAGEAAAERTPSAPPDPSAPSTAPTLTPRQHAQQQLARLGYQPSTVQAHWPPIALGAALLPWFSTRDHPPEHVAAGRFDVSTPESIAQWVQRLWPHTQRLELCHTRHHLVLRRQGPPLDERCTPAPGDEVHPLPHSADERR